MRQEISPGRHFPSPSAAKCTPLSPLWRPAAKAGAPFRNLYLADFGRAHLAGTDKLSGPPLPVFYRDNPATYDPLICRFLAGAFYLYAVDIVGHPGKGAEASFPACDRWASQAVLG